MNLYAYINTDFNVLGVLSAAKIKYFKLVGSKTIIEKTIFLLE